MIFSFLNQNIRILLCCGYSKEPSHLGSKIGAYKACCTILSHLLMFLSRLILQQYADQNTTEIRNNILLKTGASVCKTVKTDVINSIMVRPGVDLNKTHVYH